jgi:predicted aspartyl protease
VRARVLLLPVALVACGGGTQQAVLSPASQPGPTAAVQFATPSTDPAPSSAAPEPRTQRKTMLRFELRGREFPLPVVHGTIAGEPVWMLVDTGANSHVIARWVARKVGMPLRPLGDVGTDHTGRSVTTYSVEHPRVAIDDWGPLTDGPMLVTDVPEAIERLGIGAFVSPQWLGAEDEAVVLDLRGREMHTSAFDEATRALEGHGRSLTVAPARLCEDMGSAIKGLAFVVQASVDGHAVELLLDTGAHRTDLLTTSRTGHKLEPRSLPSKEQMYAASGLVRTRVVKAAQVRVGEHSMVADIDLVPGVADPVCPRDGVVSMDVLKSCVLVLGRKQVSGRCGD